MIEYVLVPSPLVGPPSLEPAAQRLRGTGAIVTVPETSAPDGVVPPWRDCAAFVRSQIRPGENTMLVGHSASAPEDTAAAISNIVARLA